MMNLTSSAFLHLADIPKRYTCEGADQSPPLSWAGIPAQAQSLVVIIDDPDAPDPDNPKMTWVHWVLYNIPPNTTGLNSAKPGLVDLPLGTLSGLNDAQETSYHGPCPPVGRHRYFHKLYALDIILPDLHLPTKAILEKEMQGHIIAQCELIGTYKKGG